MPTVSFSNTHLHNQRGTLLLEGHKVNPKHTLQSGYKYKCVSHPIFPKNRCHNFLTTFVSFPQAS